MFSKLKVKAKAKRQKLHKELTILVLIKVGLIYLIWTLFFAHPTVTTLTGKSVSEHLFNVSTPTAQSEKVPSGHF